MMGGTVMAFLAGVHYWWPKIWGRMYNEFWAKIAAGLLFVGFNMTFFVQFILGSKGMPRRYYSYLDQYQPLHAFSSVGSFVIGAAFFVMAFYLLHSIFKGKQAPRNPWGALTFEWETQSPPIHHNFETIPSAEDGPYDYDRIMIVDDMRVYKDSNKK
jgi:cytochrome c oxidase subunit 1